MTQDDNFLPAMYHYYHYHLLSLRLLKTFFDNVLLEQVGLPHILPLAVHLDFLVGVSGP